MGDVQPSPCGRDRWPVKTLSDRDAAKVNLNPVDATISELAQIAVRKRRLPQDGRIALEELTTYRLKGTVQRIAIEKDHDWHLILADLADPRITITVEIPDPLCTVNVNAQRAFVKSRNDLHWIPRKGVAEVTGVGFFDHVHTKSGHGKNGFELHPVLSIRRLTEQEH